MQKLNQALLWVARTSLPLDRVYSAHGFMYTICIFFSGLLINNFHIAAAGVNVRVVIFAHFNFALYQSTLFQADTRA